MPYLRKRLHTVLNNTSEAFQLNGAMTALKNSSSYQNIAKIHGNNQFECQHHNHLFLPWHRLYLHEFEKIFVSAQPGANKIGLPYWDWTQPTQLESSFFTTNASWNTLTSSITSRNSKFNSYLANIWQPVQVGSQMIPWLGTTATPWPGASQNLTNNVNNINSFQTFYNAIESIHDDFHASRIGGSMLSINNAAFDPIFWFTHANIDRLWCQWQDKHQSNKPCSDVLNYKLRIGNGSIFTVSTILSTSSLNYSYFDCANSNQKILINTTVPTAGIQNLLSNTRIYLNVEIFNKQFITYQIDAYLNGDLYAGSAFVFGHEPGTSMPRRHRQMMSDGIVRTIDITEAFEKIARPNMPLQVQLRARPIDSNINIPLEDVAVIGIDLERYAAATPE